jgi:hypothetical protein
MPKPHRAPAHHVYLADFAKADLDALIHRLCIEVDYEVGPVVMLGALVLAAQGLPAEIVQGLVPAYLRAERAELDRLANQGRLTEPESQDLPTDERDGEEIGESW